MFKLIAVAVAAIFGTMQMFGAEERRVVRQPGFAREHDHRRALGRGVHRRRRHLNGCRKEEDAQYREQQIDPLLCLVLRSSPALLVDECGVLERRQRARPLLVGAPLEQASSARRSR